MRDSAKAGERANPYGAPAAAVRDDSEGFRISPGLIAFATSFVVLYSLAFFAYWITDDVASFEWLLVGLLLSAFSTLTGAIFMRFQRMRWYWIVLAAPLFAVTVFVAVVYSTRGLITQG